jgi:hypothetical protein
MKTASTFLQQKIFPRIEPITFVGWHTKVAPREWDSDAVYQLMNTLRHDDLCLQDFVSSVEKRDLCAGLSDYALLSDEGIATDRENFHRNIQRIAAIDPNARVLYSIRNQRTYLLSQYYQFQRGVFGNKDWTLLSPSEFFTGKGRYLLSDTFYSKKIKALYDVFGHENVTVVPYELLVHDQQQYANLITNFFDLKKGALNELIGGATPSHTRNDQKKRDHRVYQIMDKVLSGNRSRYFASVKGLRHFCYQDIDEKHIDAVLSKLNINYSKDNVEASKMIGLDLNHLGYRTSSL